MDTTPLGSETVLAGLLGLAPESVRTRLGAAGSERVVGEERWLMYDGAGWSLRLRLAPAAGPSSRVRSWTARFDHGHASPDDALRATGLEEVVGPVSRPHGSGPLCAALADPATGATHSLTLTLRGGEVVAMTGFDEAPDWTGGRSPS